MAKKSPPKKIVTKQSTYQNLHDSFRSNFSRNIMGRR